eukprot:PITA_22002
MSERIFPVDLQRWNMGGAPRCEKMGLKKGPWTPEEDQILVNYILKNGHGNWRAVPQLAGLPRCSKSCRLRWMNYLRPDIKRGSFTEEEGRTIIQLHGILGSRWSMIASNLPGRTDNEIKNFWNSRLKKRLLKMGLDPSTHKPIEESNPNSPHEYEAWAVRRHKAQWENARLEAEARLSRESLIMSYHTNGSTVETTTMPNNNPPADYFLKMWNSEAGKAFRKENHYPNGGGDDPLLSSVLSSLHPDDNDNDVEKDNTFQQCNSASFEWIGDCNVETPKVGNMTKDKAIEELGFLELPLDFLDTDDSNANIESELRKGFQQQVTSPLPELLQKDYWSNMSLIAHAPAF